MATMVHGGGGGGVSSSELTAVGANVLEGTTYVGKDTNDESKPGTMTNYASSSTEGYPNYLAAVYWYPIDTSGNVVPWIRFRVPKAGYYNSNNFLYAVASTFGNATPKQVLSGRLFTSNDGLKATGTMTNRSGTEGSYGNYSASASWDTTNKRVRMKIPAEAFYNTYNYLYSAGTNFGDVGAGSVLEGKTFTSNAGLKVTGTLPNYGGLSKTGTVTASSGSISIKPTAYGFYNTSSSLTASIPNLTKANIKSGVNIAGLVGEFEGYVATNKEIYDNGAWGSGYSKNIITKESAEYSSWTITYDETCIIFDWGITGWRGYGLNLFSASSPINVSGYSHLYIEASAQSYVGSAYDTSRIMVGVYDITGTQISSASKEFGSTNTKVTLDVNLSSITQSVYFNIDTYARRSYSGGSDQYTPDFTIYNIKFT